MNTLIHSSLARTRALFVLTLLLFTTAFNTRGATYLYSTNYAINLLAYNGTDNGPEMVPVAWQFQSTTIASAFANASFKKGRPPTTPCGIPDGLVVHIWDWASQSYITDGYTTLFGWDYPNAQLLPGHGFYIQTPSDDFYQVTFNGTRVAAESVTFTFEANKLYFIGCAYPVYSTSDGSGYWLECYAPNTATLNSFQYSGNGGPTTNAPLGDLAMFWNWPHNTMGDDYWKSVWRIRSDVAPPGILWTQNATQPYVYYTCSYGTPQLSLTTPNDPNNATTEIYINPNLQNNTPSSPLGRAFWLKPISNCQWVQPQAPVACP